MTVYDLISTNHMITDLEITVRIDGRLLDQLNIGCAEGVKPPYPTRVPVDEKYINANGIYTHTHRDAHYIDKSINAWDDGKDYWQIKTNRIPKEWLNLEVTLWDSHPASTVRTTNPRRHRNNGFYGERLRINVLPSGQKLEIKQKPEISDQIDGQMSFEDLEVEE